MARPHSNTTALQGHYAKDYIQDRLEKEKKIAGDSDNIEIPIFILGDEIAVAEFNRLVKELKKADLIANVDSNELGLYADSYSNYYECTLALRNQPLVVEYVNKSGNVNQVANPYIKIQQQYAANLRNIGSSFGLNPASRSKLASLTPSDKEEKVDKLTEILSLVK